MTVNNLEQACLYLLTIESCYLGALTHAYINMCPLLYVTVFKPTKKSMRFCDRNSLVSQDVSMF